MATDENPDEDVNLPCADDFADESDPVPDLVIATCEATYCLTSDGRRDWNEKLFHDAVRRSDQVVCRMEFDKCDGEGLSMSKRIEMEFAVRTLIHSTRNPFSAQHLFLAADAGSHSPWKFLIFPEYKLPLPKFMDELDQEENKAPYQLRAAIHTFLGIESLHRMGIIHGNIRPENFYVGKGPSRCRVMLANFEHASSQEHKALPQGTDLVDLVFASRGRIRNFEQTKKDDMESWLYSIAWLYHPLLTPWHPDHNLISAPTANHEKHEKEMLKLKRAFCTKKLWKVQRVILFPEFGPILLQMLKTIGRSEPPYANIWDCLASANKYIDCSPFEGWGVVNSDGAMATPSPHSCTPITKVPREYAGRDA